MSKCKVCHAWQPKQWDTWRYIDQTAPCAYTNEATASDHTCEKFSILRPKDFVARTEAVGRTKFALTETCNGDQVIEHDDFLNAMNDWYKQNQSKFDMVNIREEDQEEGGHVGTSKLLIYLDDTGKYIKEEVIVV